MKSLAFTLLLLLPAAARAQDAGGASAPSNTPAAEAPENPPETGLEPKEKFLAGSEHYLDSETTLTQNFHSGANISLEYQYFQSDAASGTPVFTLGAGKDWDQGSLSFLYAAQPKINDYKMTSLDLIGSLNTEDRDLRTSLGLDFNVTNHTQTVEQRRTSSDVSIRQVTPTITASQRYYGWKLTAEFGHSTYDRDVQAIANKIKPTNSRLSGLAGILQGFPDVTWKFGLSYDFDEVPVTVWTDYTHIRMLVTQSTSFAFADTVETGVDYDLNKTWTAGVEWEYLAQTGQSTDNYFGGTVVVHL